MITLYGKYRYPNRWEELSPRAFLRLYRLLLEFLRGTLTEEQVRVLYFLQCAGIHPRRIAPRYRARFAENLFRITRTLNFMFRYEYPEGALSELKPALQLALAKNLPDDLPYQPELEYVKKLSRTTVPDLIFAKNLLPRVRVRHKTYKGYVFEVINNIIHTDLTAAQYVDAHQLYEQLVTARDTAYFTLLAATLYCPQPYSSAKALTLSRTFSTLDNDTAQAVFVCFQAVQGFLATRTKYALLWARRAGGENSKKLSLGLADSLYSLSATGYGSNEQVANLPLTAFLDLLLKNLVDAVKQLQAMEMDKAEIAEKTGLNLAQINQII